MQYEFKVAAAKAAASGFWDGTGSALVGSLGAGLIAVATIAATRRLDRRNLRDQVGLDAATRLLDAGLNLAYLLEYRLENWDDFGAWVEAVLEKGNGFLRLVMLNAPLIADDSLRDLLWLTADRLHGAFIDEIGFAEGRAIAEGLDPLTAVLEVKDEEHQRFSSLLRDLNSWRASFGRKHPLSDSTRAALKARPQPYWQTIRGTADDDERT